MAEFLADLPNVVDREPEVHDHETVPPELTAGRGGLLIYTLTPSRITRRSPDS
jgi:hypothetical protein